MVFMVRLFLPVQGALGRGFGRNCTERAGAGKGVLKDTFSSVSTLVIWVFPRLFPQRDSRFHTHNVAPVSRLDRKKGAGRAGSRAVAPKGLRGRGRVRPTMTKEPDPAKEERKSRIRPKRLPWPKGLIGKSRLQPALLDRNRTSNRALRASSDGTVRNLTEPVTDGTLKGSSLPGPGA